MIIQEAAMNLCSSRVKLSGRHCLRLLVAMISAGAFCLGVSGSSVDAQVGRFNDVPADAYYATPVTELDDMGVFEGTALDGSMCPEGFCPSVPVDRKTAAVWVVRILDGQDPPEKSSRFDDVDCCLDEFWPPFIERMAELGVTRGCGDGGSGFCPNEDTTRAEMAAFLSRAFDLSDGPAPGFDDVADDAWYLADVARLKAAGITQGCGDGSNFCPNRVTTRAEMAAFLYRGLVGDGGFDPRRTPTVTGVDLDKINYVADNIDLDISCFSTKPPDTSDQIVEILRFVDGCLFMNYQVLGDRTLQEVREQYADDSSVMAIDYSVVVELDQDANLDPSNEFYQWHLDRVAAPELQKRWPEGAEVTVAVIDTGVDASHLDIKPNITDFKRTSRDTKDSNSIIVDCLTEESPDELVPECTISAIDTRNNFHMTDPDGHGTHVAGIIAAEGSVHGIAPDASILPVTAVGTHRRIPITEAILTAIYERVDIVNMSFRTTCLDRDVPVSCHSRPLEFALRTADLQQILLVASAGNNGTVNGVQTQWPALYRNAIGVANIDSSNVRNRSSSKGPHVKIAAPGTRILSTEPSMSHGKKTGTSMAAPIVSGVLAHLVARFPNSSPALLRSALYHTAEHPNNKTKEKEDEYGYGIIQPLKAIEWLQKRTTTKRVHIAWGTDAADRDKCPDNANCLNLTYKYTGNWEQSPYTVECWSNGARLDGPFQWSGKSNTGCYYWGNTAQVIINGIRSNIITHPRSINPTTLPQATNLIGTGWDHSCAIRSDDTIICWGDIGNAPVGTFKSVSAGKFHSCAIRSDDTIICWGDIGNAPVGTFKSVSAGRYHSCAIRSDDTIVCWGYNDDGQTEAPSGTFKSVSAGGWHSCATRSDGSIVCWGSNDDGRAEAPSGTFKSVNAGGSFSCAIRSDDTIVCWGRNEYGQTEAPSGTFKSVNAGGSFSCAIRSDDTIVCWGYNDDGQTEAPSGTFKSVSAGDRDHACAMRSDGSIICWGDNDDGQTEVPSNLAKTVRISWGNSAVGRSDCPAGVNCLNLTYEYIGDNWGSAPYTVECWANRQRIFGPFQWSGQPHTGCYYWGGTAQVVINGIRSNTLTHPSG